MENKCKDCGYTYEEHEIGGPADVPYCYKFIAYNADKANLGGKDGHTH